MKCLWTDSQTRHHSCRSGRVSGEGEELEEEEGGGLVVLKEGEKVVAAVGGKVGRVQVG